MLGLDERAIHWADRAEDMRNVILDAAWNEDRRAFPGAFGGEALDASVLLMGEFGFVDPMNLRYIVTVEGVDEELREGSHVFRYTGLRMISVRQNGLHCLHLLAH
jgi:GH15 family glucan-1,4-alpha-glucosidase